MLLKPNETMAEYLPKLIVSVDYYELHSVERGMEQTHCKLATKNGKIIIGSSGRVVPRLCVAR